MGRYVAYASIPTIATVIEYQCMHACTQPANRSIDEITLFKNGGGAHLELMTAQYILNRVEG